MKHVIAAMGLGLIFAGSGHAAELDGCSLTTEDYAELVAPLLDGAWLVHNGPGVAMMQSGGKRFKTALPKEAAEPMTMRYDAGQVFADMAYFGDAPVRVIDAQREIALVPVKGRQRDMDYDKLGFAPNCSSDVMLRVEFEGTYTEVDMLMSAHFHLAVLDEDHLSGVMILQAESMGVESHARRLVTFTRN
jgi:hypothetical protein